MYTHNHALTDILEHSYSRIFAQVRRTDMHPEKPRFLTHLQKFIDEELGQLRLADKFPCKTRLQVGNTFLRNICRYLITYYSLANIYKCSIEIII